jgi:arylsulfatase A-like enzyme
MKDTQLGILCLAALAVIPAGCNDSARRAAHPNIVLILADDMGWGDVNINGNKLVETPVLNRLSKQSMSFDRFYVCPLSAPTRSEILTGRYFLRTGVSSVTRGFENMRTNEVTIAEILKENDYITGCFGKWHNGGHYQQHPNRQGFDEFVGFCVGHLGYYFDALYQKNDDEIQSSGYSTDFFTDQAISFITRNTGNPFFCYVSYNVPHSPFQVPEKYFNKYKVKGLDDELSSVYGMVENMDQNIGRILLKLDQLKIRKNTIVVFLSDNGPNTVRYNGEMKGIKGSVDEGGVRVPCYISWPGSIKRGNTSQLAQDIDILPTLLRFCKIKSSSEMAVDGRDLSGIITLNEKPEDRYIFSRQGLQPLDACIGSVRNEHYRLVVTGKDTLLYDMLKDPSQKRDISGTERSTGLLLASVYSKWEQEMISEYIPVTAIEAGFPAETRITLLVQDATLSGKIKYSSIHPNQAHTENWQQNGDSIFWKLNINNAGTYMVELEYGCPASETGSKMVFKSRSQLIPFTIDKPFESIVLPDRDYVKRSESHERTWIWMTIGNVDINPGSELLVLKLLEKKKEQAGLIKAIRLVKL